jgi:hypothetical protein
MRRVMGPEEFSDWFMRFLPDVAAGEPATLFTPAVVTDRADGKIAHLDGLESEPCMVLAFHRERLLATDTPFGTARSRLRVGIWQPACPILPSTTWGRIGLQALRSSRSVPRSRREAIGRCGPRASPLARSRQRMLKPGGVEPRVIARAAGRRASRARRASRDDGQGPRSSQRPRRSPQQHCSSWE